MEFNRECIAKTHGDSLSRAVMSSASTARSEPREEFVHANAGDRAKRAAWHAGAALSSQRRRFWP